MKIQKEHKGNLVRIDEMEGGEVFLYGIIPCMKMIAEPRKNGCCNAVNLGTGNFMFIDEDEEFYMADYEFRLK